MQRKLYATFAVMCTLVFLVPLAWAQVDTIMGGKDPSGNILPVRVDASGNLITSGAATTPAGAAAGTHGACTNTTMNVGTTGTACPAAPRADRTSVLIQLVQSGETLTVTEDGTTATSTVGAAVADGTAYNDNLAGTVSTNCRCTAATCSVRIVECP